jgi:hypothetical protein
MPSNGEFALRDLFTWLGHIITGTTPDINIDLPSAAEVYNLSMPADIEKNPMRYSRCGMLSQMDKMASQWALMCAHSRTE